LTMHTASHENRHPLWHIRVYGWFQVVNQEWLPIDCNAGLGFEPLFEQGQRTRARVQSQ